MMVRSPSRFVALRQFVFTPEPGLRIGHMIVELLDYRPPKAKDPILESPDKSRVVLSPNSETLWTNLCLLNQKDGNVWTDEDTLEVEAQILVCVLHALHETVASIASSDVHNTAPLFGPRPTFIADSE